MPLHERYDPFVTFAPRAAGTWGLVLRVLNDGTRSFAEYEVLVDAFAAKYGSHGE